MIVKHNNNIIDSFLNDLFFINNYSFPLKSECSYSSNSNLEKLQDKYADLGVQVWGINVEQENQAGRDFISKVNVNFPILFDDKNTLSALYHVDAMPTTVIVDRSGQVRSVFRGYKAGYEKKYAKAIKRLIRE